jgi:endoribonuclease LACTB2
MERRAAAAVLFRRVAGELEVYLVRRSPALEFLGGFHAFPGGSTDDADAAAFPAEPRVSTAVRELFEETGVLALPGSQRVSVAERLELRKRLVAGESERWGEMLARLRLAVPRLSGFGRWVTPPYTPVVFDALYFAVWLPEDETPEIWPGELVDGAWWRPGAALEAHERGELFISYPVLETLKAIERSGVDGAAEELMARDGTYPHAGGEMIAGVHVAPVRTYTLPPATHTNCYVLGVDDFVVIDPACPDDDEQERLLAYLRFLIGERGMRAREIWLTHHHKDHVGAVERLRAELGLRVAAHRLTARALEGAVQVDRFIEDGEVVELGRARWQALHTPGHARGHLCFWDEVQGTLISGDNVLGLGTVLISPPEGNMADYLASLRRLLSLRLGFLFPAHGPPVAAAGEKIRFYIEHRLAREAAIVEALAAGALTPSEIVPRVYTDVSPAVFPLAEINVRAHLEKLVAEARVRVDGDAFALL